jgi:predicted nucleic acid-binding protein
MVRNSAVVLAELWRGSQTTAEGRFLEQLEANYPVWIPTQKNWLESGQVIGRIRQTHGFLAPKLRDLHFDVLIALTAKSYGARVITSNRDDFELIARYRDFDLEVWS